MTLATCCYLVIDGATDTRPRRIAAVRFDPGDRINDKKGIGWVKEDGIGPHRKVINDLKAQA